MCSTAWVGLPTAEVLNSAALHEVVRNTGGSFYPEGYPTHPAYPAGHAAIASACAAVLKAFFKESAIFPEPVLASAGGLSPLLYKGLDLSEGKVW